MTAGARKRWSLAVWGGAGLILLAPLAAMQFSDEMDWSAFDFALVGGLLAMVCLGLELAVRRSASWAYRAAAGLALGAGALLVVLNGALGVIGSEDEAANLLFAAVPAVALIGALIARFRPGGMAGAMAGAALAQVLVPAVAAIVWPASQPLVWTPQVLGLTAGFAALWLGSAWLFRRA